MDTVLNLLIRMYILYYMIKRSQGGTITSVGTYGM